MGDRTEAMQAHGDAAPIADLACDGHSVFIKSASSRKLAGGIGDIPQTVERTRDSPVVVQLPPDGEGFPMSRLGPRVVALKVRQCSVSMKSAGVSVLPFGVGCDG